MCFCISNNNNNNNTNNDAPRLPPRLQAAVGGYTWGLRFLFFRSTTCEPVCAPWLPTPRDFDHTS